MIRKTKCHKNLSSVMITMYYTMGQAWDLQNKGGEKRIKLGWRIKNKIIQAWAESAEMGSESWKEHVER